MLVGDLIADYHTSEFGHFYSFERHLGSGSYGSVELYREKVSGFPRAVKRINKSEMSASQLQTLKDEASLMKSMDHPNIVRLFAVYEDHETLLLVMECCDGGDLFSELEKIRRYPEELARKYIRQVCRALAYIHSRGIVHRDLKPENFLLCTGGILKIADFGLSKRFREDAPGASSNLLYTRAGSPYYVAREVLLANRNLDPNVPEENVADCYARAQATGNVSAKIAGGYDERTDIWSMGIVAFLLMAGTLPFMHQDDTMIMRLIIRAQPPLDQYLTSRVSPEAVEFIRRCLLRVPSDRFSAVEALDSKWLRTEESTCLTPQPSETATMDASGFLRAVRRFSSAPSLKRRALHALAYSTMSDSELADLRALFDSLDVSRAGCVDKASLESTLHALIQSHRSTRFSPDRREAIVKSIIETLFSNNSGNSKGIGCSMPRLEWSSFVAAALDRRVLLRSETLRSAFDLLDVDKDGFLEGKEIEALLEDPRVTKVFSEVDGGEFAQRVRSCVEGAGGSMDDDIEDIEGYRKCASSNSSSVKLSFDDFERLMQSRAFDPSQCFTQSQEFSSLQNLMKFSSANGGDQASGGYEADATLNLGYDDDESDQQILMPSSNDLIDADNDSNCMKLDESTTHNSSSIDEVKEVVNIKVFSSTSAHSPNNNNKLDSSDSSLNQKAYIHPFLVSHHSERNVHPASNQININDEFQSYNKLLHLMIEQSLTKSPKPSPHLHPYRHTPINTHKINNNEDGTEPKASKRQQQQQHNHSQKKNDPTTPQTRPGPRPCVTSTSSIHFDLNNYDTANVNQKNNNNNNNTNNHCVWNRKSHISHPYELKSRNQPALLAETKDSESSAMDISSPTPSCLPPVSAANGKEDDCATPPAKRRITPSGTLTSAAKAAASISSDTLDDSVRELAPHRRRATSGEDDSLTPPSKNLKKSQSGPEDNIDI